MTRSTQLATDFILIKTKEQDDVAPGTAGIASRWWSQEAHRVLFVCIWGWRGHCLRKTGAKAAFGCGSKLPKI